VQSDAGDPWSGHGPVPSVLSTATMEVMRDMAKHTFLRRLALVLPVVLLCAVGVLWWVYCDLKSEHARLDTELKEARALGDELARLRELHASMRADLQGLFEWLREGAYQAKPGVEGSGLDEVPLSALQRLIAMLEEQNKELAEDLKTAEDRAAELGRKLDLTRAERNQATVGLARAEKQLAGKATEAEGLQTKLSGLEKQLQTSTAEGVDLRKQLETITVERAKLLAAKTSLEERVKALADAESEQGAAMAALTRQLDETKKQAADLKRQVETLKQQVEALKKQGEKTAD